MREARGPKSLQERYIFFALFLVMFFLIGLLIWPYISSLIFAGILAGAFYPLLELGIRRFRIRRRIWAAVVCLIILLLVFLPTIYIIMRLVQETLELYNRVQSPKTAKMLQDVFFGDGYPAVIGRQIFDFLFPDLKYGLDTVREMLIGAAKNLSGSMIGRLNQLLGNTMSFLFQFVVMLLVIYAIFVEGPYLKRFFLKLSPLPDEDEELIIQKFNEMNFTTLVTNGIGGVIQGGLAGIGFAVAGVGSTLLFTVLMIILAFIPLVGISFVFVPVCLYLLVTGEIITSIVLFFYCAAIAILTENWFKPLFMGNRLRINSLLVLFSIIGGMTAFGMAGIFYGPLIVSIFLTFVHLYQKRYAEPPGGGGMGNGS